MSEIADRVKARNTRKKSTRFIEPVPGKKKRVKQYKHDQFQKNVALYIDYLVNNMNNPKKLPNPDALFCDLINTMEGRLFMNDNIETILNDTQHALLLSPLSKEKKNIKRSFINMKESIDKITRIYYEEVDKVILTKMAQLLYEINNS